MTNHVTDILMKAGANKERVTPVDVVMGDHWAELDLGTSARLSLLRHVLRKQQTGGGVGGAHKARLRIPLEVVRRSPQAMVKVIRKGGTTNARGMRDQMSYLEKDGDARLERSERYFGTELDSDEKEVLIEAWGLAGENKTNSDKTTHFVVSFPSDTDHGAAYRAGRAWAEEMFASGTYRDVFDYYTAFHTDRAHPHIHVIVNRRGLENGDWLKVSRRSQFNYDEFRAVQVEVAAPEGIILEASPRLARGVTDRPIPDAEIRKAEKEKREARAPAHTPVTAVRAAAMVSLHARQMRADARLLEDHYPDLAKKMKTVSQTIMAGRKIATEVSQIKTALTIKEAHEKSEFIMSRRNEILDGIKQIDTEIGTIQAGPERASIERDASRMKADAADLMPDVGALQAYAKGNDAGLYRGIGAEDQTEQQIKARADVEVGERAQSVGIDPAIFVSRYNGPEAAPQALSDRWRKDELEDIQKNLAYRGGVPADQYEQLAQAAYDDLHRNALQSYRKAEHELETHAAKKRQLQRMAKLMRTNGVGKVEPTDASQTESFRQLVKDTLHATELHKLEAGQTDTFKHVTKNVDEQRALSRHYLEAEVPEADGTRKHQLSTVLAKIANDQSRDTDLPAQDAARGARKDRGLDR